MSRLAAPPASALTSSGGARGFLLICQALAHALAYPRLGAGKATMKIVEQARKEDDAIIVYGTMNVLREMDVRHPAALFVQEMVEGHHRAFGFGCTTLVAQIGLFAGAVTELRRLMQLQPSVVALTLADIRDRCVAIMDATRELPDGRKEACVMPLTQLIDEYMAAQPAAAVMPSVAVAAPPVAPAPLPNDDDESDASWFFEGDGAPLDLAPPSLPMIPAALAAAAAAATPPTSTLHSFLIQLGSGLAHGQDASMGAAVAVVGRLLRMDGIWDVQGLRGAMGDAPVSDEGEDITEHWDLGGTLTVHTRLGPATMQQSAQQEDTQQHQRWEIVEGMLLDVLQEDVSAVRATLASLRRSRHSSSASSSMRTSHHATTILELEEEETVPVGVVLVLGDVAGPASSATVSVRPGHSGASVLRDAMHRSEQRMDSFLDSLVRRLRSLDVSLVLAKGSVDKVVRAHLRSQGFLCFELVNLPEMERVSRLARAPCVSELGEVTAAHVGRARVRVRTTSLGWNADTAHQNVIREMDKDRDSAEQQGGRRHKLVLAPDLEDVDASGADAHSAHFTLLSTHATPIHARIFVTSFWNCLHRLRHALRDRCVLRGGGAVEELWARSVEGHADAIQAQIATVLSRPDASTSAASQAFEASSANVESLAQQVAVHRAIAQAFRNFVQLLANNADEGTHEQRWVAAQGQAPLQHRQFGPSSSSWSSSAPLYDCRGSLVSSLRTSTYLFQLFLHVDATLLCANGRTVYQSMDGRTERAPSAISVL